MSQTLEERIKQLVTDHFPWEEEAQEKRPTSYEDQKKYVESWLSKEKLLEPHAFRVAELHKLLEQILASSSFLALCLEGGKRFVSKVDPSNHIKLPPSILEKMARAWIEKGNEDPPIKFHQILREIDDLARLRIVVNFLSDMRAVCEALEAPYTSKKVEISEEQKKEAPEISEEQKKEAPKISEEQKKLREDFDLIESKFTDKLHVDPKNRKKGERCYKGIFCSKKTDTVKIEVQIVTMLQESWDKKDHFLIYEPSRQGKETKPEDRIRSYALSESLYLHDTVFEQMLNEIYPKK